jgi:2-polyprenyl-3-methyl-5-hydroxy-6-metoxy-1,4-benzoquinol methylase
MSDILEKVYSQRNVREKNRGGDHGSFSYERGKLFSKWIGTGKQVLDIGCCNCILTKYYVNENHVTGLDIDGEALKLCPSEVKTERWDLNSYWHEGKEGMFDVVVASEVIEHLYYPDKVLEKIHFVLKPNGYLIGSVPNAFNLKNRVRLFLAKKRATPLGEPTHINHFSYRELYVVLSMHFEEVELIPIVQKKWRWFAILFPGLGSFLLAFRAKKRYTPDTY